MASIEALSASITASLASSNFTISLGAGGGASVVSGLVLVTFLAIADEELTGLFSII